MDKSKVEKILLPVTVEKNQEREETVRSQFWSKFNSYAVQLPFAEDVAAAWFCAIDTKTPIKVRGTLFAALAYFIMPADLVPDIIAFLGFTDDIAVFTAAFSMIKGHITEEHREQARAAIDKAKSEEV